MREKVGASHINLTGLQAPHEQINQYETVSKSLMKDASIGKLDISVMGD